MRPISISCIRLWWAACVTRHIQRKSFSINWEIILLPQCAANCPANDSSQKDDSDDDEYDNASPGAVERNRFGGCKFGGDSLVFSGGFAAVWDGSVSRGE